MLRPSRDTSVTGLAAIMREGVVIVFCFVCSTVIGWYWHKLLSVSHTPLRSFRNNVQRVYTQQRWWISQLARFRPRNRVWTWTLRAKTGERETYRKMAIDQTHGEVIPWDYFPLFLFWTISVYFSVREMSAQTRCMAQYFHLIDDVSSVTGYCFPEKQLRMQMTSYQVCISPSHTSVTCPRGWCSLAFFAFH